MAGHITGLVITAAVITAWAGIIGWGVWRILIRPTWVVFGPGQDRNGDGTPPIGEDSAGM
jgi:hypothetical protein